MTMDTAFETALYGALAGGTALTALLAGGTASPSVYNMQAPAGAATPFVVFNQLAVTPVWTMREVAYEDAQYQVQAVTTGPSTKVAAQIAAAVDAILSDAALSVTGYGTRYVRRAGGVAYTETVDGQRYNHRGHIYRVLLDPN